MTTRLTDRASPLHYDFEQLEGIVFGMRMSVEDKLRITQVIEQKCRAEGRYDFRFFQSFYFQSFYSPEKGKMDINELRLLTYN